MSANYTSPLSKRYPSKEMKYLFSPEKKFKTWRKLWIALAETERELGLDITAEQIAQLKEFKDDINFEVAEQREKEVRHDVMSHVYAYGVQCPDAKGIIHLGATSCYVGVPRRRPPDSAWSGPHKLDAFPRKSHSAAAGAFGSWPAFESSAWGPGNVQRGFPAGAKK